jgi:glycosyltransferase domain-containing protein
MADKNSYPLVSIGVPTYNGGEGLRRALKTVFDQGYPNLEIVISDNCSTDNTSEIIAEMAKEHPEIKYHRQPQNTGIYNNFFYVLKHSTGKYFMWVSDDDTTEPGTLSKCVDFLETHPDFIIATGKIGYWVRQENGKDKFVTYDGDTIDNTSPSKRVVQFYSQVRWGALFHGLMRCKEAQQAIPPNVYGYDYHFVACLAFLGKFAVLDFHSYNKYLGGLSKSWAKFAKLLGEPDWVGNFPFVKMAIDANKMIQRHPIFDGATRLTRTSLGVQSAATILYSNYPRKFFRLGWNKFKRIFNGAEPHLKEQVAK